MPRKTALASCAGDAQLWDISDPWNPTTERRGQAHAHLQPVGGRQFEFIHSGVVSWDGKTFAIMDETGGGVTANCFGDRDRPTASTTSTTWSKPGDAGARAAGPLHDPAQPGLGDLRVAQRDRDPDQGPQAHERVLLPGRRVDGRLHRPSNVRGGGLRRPRRTATGRADEWSSYWYNGRIYSNSGLNRRGSDRQPRPRRLRAHGRARPRDARAESWRARTRRRRRRGRRRRRARPWLAAVAAALVAACGGGTAAEERERARGRRGSTRTARSRWSARWPSTPRDRTLWIATNTRAVPRAATGRRRSR